MPTALTVIVCDEDLAVLDRHIAARRPGYSREEMIAKILSEWVGTQQPGPAAAPDEGMRPDHLNASNDS